MKVKDIIKLFVVNEQKFKIWSETGWQIISVAEIRSDSELMNREIDYMYGVPGSDFISIQLLNK